MKNLHLSRTMNDTEVSVKIMDNQLTSADVLKERKTGKKLQGKCLEMISPAIAMKVNVCFLLLNILFGCVVALSVALAVKKREQVIESPMYAACPRDWIGFGSKCFYFSEDTRNWTNSQNICLSLEAQLAQFDSLEELNFLRRFMGASDHWIGLHRKSSQQAWRWTDNTEYNNVAVIRGTAEHAYLTDKVISSSRGNADRKWICSKPTSYSLQCPRALNPF